MRPRLVALAPRVTLLRAGLGVVVVAKIVLLGLWCQSALAGPGSRAERGGEKAMVRVATAVKRDGSDAPDAHAPAAKRDGDEAADGHAATAKADGTAPADTRVASTGPAAQPGRTTPEKTDVRALLDAVARRNAELDARERALAMREERLQVFEHDVTAKVASLEEIEKRLLARSKEATAAVAAASESLAKIYGAMKPSEAAPILEQLDQATVLQIFGRMKEKQIGEILPLMSRDKAIVLTRSLADRH
jgi:flagellar motility protein MotE (MotC chaperone)